MCVFRFVSFRFVLFLFCFCFVPFCFVSFRFVLFLFCFQTNQRFFFGHDDDVSAIALHPDGDKVASGQIGRDAKVIVWYATYIHIIIIQIIIIIIIIIIHIIVWYVTYIHYGVQRHRHRHSHVDKHA
eukprot:COSAG06_NODE_3595_length_5138_cov_116.284382_7_plen_127_part_00